MNNTGKYIYGVMNTGSHAAGSGLLTSNGIYTVPYRDVSAVVSDNGIIDYTNLPGDVAARHLIQHQLVIEKVMQECTIIPMRLGTYVLNEDEIMQVLTKGYRMFKEIFKEVEGRMEIDVIASWVDLNTVIKEVSGNEEVRALKQSLLNKKEGVTVDDQIKMGVLIKGYLNKKKDEYTHTIKDSLKGLCRDMKEYTMTDDVTIMNAAFFIDNGIRIPFEERLDELNNGFSGKVHFKYIGPLPPYNFYVLEIKKLQYEEIDRARKKLGLNVCASKDDIKRAYRSYASVYHPDKQFNAQSDDTQRAEAEMEYGEITKAYGLLSEYCQHESCSFEEEDFAGNSIIVRIKEQ
ncbi:MAG: GvpL/GvpF family gas vesicle protein [Syntrophorhabdaceae bacterium]|nr:GvpL/GvpF family gas vesicle protein [Syntrophorhabdaceae bacterium]MDD5242765.1 GvpL/GvpF family gas vesicle protein [Syntrophorhabdaceae bacterium]